MPRLDVYPALRPSSAGYVLDVQADRLSHLNVRTLVPLLPADSAPAPIRDLNPIFLVEGQPHVMATQFIFTAPSRELGRKVASLADMHDAVRNALDCLLGSY